MKRLLTIVTWTFMFLAVVAFWISLRSESDQQQYTLLALAFIAVAFTSNYFLKKNEKAEKE